MSRQRKNENLKKSKDKSTSRASSSRSRSRSAARIPNKPKEAHGARKAPRQSRSKQMVKAILQAAAEIFARLGYARTTTNKIAERAGVSVGSLYQYFPNKDSLLASLMAEHHADVDKIVGASLKNLANPKTDLETELRQLIFNLVDLHLEDPNLTKALSSSVLRESPAGEKSNQQDYDLARHVGELLASRPDVRSGNYLAMAAILGQVTNQLSRWLVHDDMDGMDLSNAKEEVVQLLLRFLKK